MVKYILRTVFLFYIVFSSYALNSQWLSDHQLTHDSIISITEENNGKSIAAKGDTIIVIHQTKMYGYWHIYARLSFDNGSTWEDSTKLAGSSLMNFYHPSIVADKRGFYAVYVNQLASDLTLVNLRVSTNGGESFSISGVGGMDGVIKSHPVVSVDSNIVHVVFSFHVSNSSQSIKYYRSTNFGNTFDEVMTWSSATYEYDYPSIYHYGSNIYLAFSGKNGSNSDILFVRSTDKGFNWGAVQQLTSDPTVQAFPSLASSGNNIYIAWEDNRYGNYDVFSCRSTNAGVTWISEVRLTSHSSDQRKPNINANGTNIHIVWEDTRDSAEIYHLSSTNYGGSWQSAQRVTFNPGTSTMPSITFSKNNLYVVWTDNRFSHNEIFFKKNPTGNAIGIQVISTEVPEKFALHQNYPNPFNPFTNIVFELPEKTYTKIIIYDINGREIENLVNKTLEPGKYNVDWNAADFPSGAYFYRIEAGDFAESKKLILVK